MGSGDHNYQTSMLFPDSNPKERQNVPGEMEGCGKRKRREVEIAERVINGQSAMLNELLLSCLPFGPMYF